MKIKERTGEIKFPSQRPLRIQEKQKEGGRFEI